MFVTTQPYSSLEEMRTAEVVTRAFDSNVIQLRQGSVYYGGCTKVAESAEQLVEILDDDPDFLDQLYLASEKLQEPAEQIESSSPQSFLSPKKNSTVGMVLGKIVPQLVNATANISKQERTSEADLDPNVQKPVGEDDHAGTNPEMLDEELITFLASPDGKEAREALQKDVEAIRVSIRTEITNGLELESIEDFRKEHLAPLDGRLVQLQNQEERLRTKAARYVDSRSTTERLLINAGENPHLVNALKQQLDDLVDPHPQVKAVEREIKTIRNEIERYQTKERALQQRWSDVHHQIETAASQHPTIQLAKAVDKALTVRRAADLSRLLGLIGCQSNQTVTELARQADLGLDGIKTIMNAVSSRKWVHTITPIAREIAKGVAVRREFEGKHLPGNARTVILRAENILILDQADMESARIHVGPDGIGRWSKGQPGRPWRVKKEDTWTI